MIVRLQDVNEKLQKATQAESLGQFERSDSVVQKRSMIDNYAGKRTDSNSNTTGLADSEDANGREEPTSLDVRICEFSKVDKSRS